MCDFFFGYDLFYVLIYLLYSRLKVVFAICLLYALKQRDAETIDDYDDYYYYTLCCALFPFLIFGFCCWIQRYIHNEIFSLSHPRRF